MKLYDLLVIGGGFSSITFVSNLLKSGIKAKVAIVEAGRNLGGRCSLKSSVRNIDWKIHHGSPNFNIHKDLKDSLISDFLGDLLFRKLIFKDNSYLFEIDENFNFLTNPRNDFCKGIIYKPSASMSNLLLKLLQIYDINKLVDIFFSTLIVDLDYFDNKWRLVTNSGEKFYCKFLVLSSNLILHNRSKTILSKNYVPIQKVLIKNKNILFHKLIKDVNNLKYLKRTNFIIYTNKEYKYKLLNQEKDMHFFFNKKAEDKIGIERVVFQRQNNNSLGIVVHTKSFDIKFNDDNLLFNDLISRLNHVFINNNYINQLHDYKDVTIMRWRSSQPIGEGISKELEICKELNIAFCGDWFDYEGYGRVEGAIRSGLSLSNRVINLIQTNF